MRRHVVAAVRMLAVMVILTGIAYPLAVTAVAQVFFHDAAEGSLVRAEDRVVGSALLGQPFDGPQWFHPRPGTGASAVSGPTNLGPSNPALAQAVGDRAAAITNRNPGIAAVPADAVTSSGSGLDPDISVANAQLQAPEVARARGMSVDKVLALIDEHTTPRTFGFLGEPRVNVLALNLALERLASQA